MVDSTNGCRAQAQAFRQWTDGAPESDGCFCNLGRGDRAPPADSAGERLAIALNGLRAAAFSLSSRCRKYDQDPRRIGDTPGVDFLKFFLLGHLAQRRASSARQAHNGRVP